MIAISHRFWNGPASWLTAIDASKPPTKFKLRSKGHLNPKSEVDRGDLTQSAGRECHSSGFAVSFDTPQPSLCHLGSASCAISSPPTSEFGLKPLAKPGSPHPSPQDWPTPDPVPSGPGTRTGSRPGRKRPTPPAMPPGDSWLRRATEARPHSVCGCRFPTKPPSPRAR